MSKQIQIVFTGRRRSSCVSLLQKLFSSTNKNKNSSLSFRLYTTNYNKHSQLCLFKISLHNIFPSINTRNPFSAMLVKHQNIKHKIRLIIHNVEYYEYHHTHNNIVP